MVKRFTDTEKYKKKFIRGLKGAYKLLWDYLYHDCDHAGIWIVDFEIAQIYLGSDMIVNKDDALKFFNNGEKRIIEFSNGNKWFIPGFIDFQYGELNPENRAHKSVINILKKHGLYDNFIKGLNKGLPTPLEGCKDKDKDMDKDKVKEILQIFNQKCGTKYKETTKSIKELISGRLSEGYTIEDFIIVIDTKYKDWSSDPKMSQYITPHTLFRPGNFPKYLNKITPKEPEELKNKKMSEDSLETLRRIQEKYAGSGENSSTDSV